MAASECARCGGRMEPGFLLEFKDGNMTTPTTWVEGTPEKAWFGTLKVRHKRKLPVQTQRCTRCGYLESYASE